jgi:hypothetical protein
MVQFCGAETFYKVVTATTIPEFYLAGGRGIYTGKHIKYRRFTCPIGTDKPHQFSMLHLTGKAAYRLEPSKVDGKVLNL